MTLIQIAIQLLGRLDQGNRFAGRLLKLRTGSPAKFPDERLQPLIDILIIEVAAHELAGFQASRHAQVMEIAGMFQHFVAMGKANLAIHLLELGPEA